MRKLLLITVIWLVIIGMVLEIGLRIAAPALPGRLQIAVQRVVGGRPYQTNKVEFMMTDSDHGYVLLPDLENVTQTVSPTVSIQFSTHSLWGSRFGFRTRPVDYLVEVAVVGDSFSFCFTAYEDCWVRHFEEETGLGTVDLAQPGTASVSHWRMIDTYARPLAPRLVLWQFFGNDFNEDYGFAVQRGEIEPVVKDEVTTLPDEPASNSPLDWLRAHSLAFAVIEVALGNEWPYLSSYERLYVEQYHIPFNGGMLGFGQPYEQQVMDMSLPQNQAGIVYTRESLQKASETVSGWGGTLAVVVIPTREEVYSFLTAPVMGQEVIDHLGDARREVFDLCDELNLLCFDPLPLLQQAAQNGEVLYYDDDLHLNARGNAVLSPLIWRWLGGNGLLYAPDDSASDED